MTRIPRWGKTVPFSGIQDTVYLGKTWRGKAEVSGELATMLMARKGYGIDFIAFSEEGGTAEIEDSFFKTNPDDGTVHCWLTGRDFVNAQGARGHRTSKEFNEAVEDYLDNLRTADL
jgi:hypothetical protein